jgi:H+-transporting ATPase
MKATVIKSIRRRRESKIANQAAHGVPLDRTASRATSIHESLYSNRVSFIKRATRRVVLGGKVSVCTS